MSKFTRCIWSPGMVVVWTIVAAVLGYYVATFLVVKPTIGIIKVKDSIDVQQMGDFARMVRYADENRHIKAVVVEIDSPGGGAPVVEDMYLNLLALRQNKPIVAAVDRFALSGGYYVAIGANEIFAKPSSFIGSVGVWMYLPSAEPPQEDLLSSGPLKLEGMTPRMATAELDMVRQAFLRAVTTERGDRLKMATEELSQGGIYVGPEALRSGLIDKLGSNREAIAKAASLAGIKKYEVLDINEELGIRPPFSFFIFGGKGPAVTSGLPEFFYSYNEPER
ncbi:MAG: S49 family peptidase [Chloroflexota bacterium]